MPNLIDHDGSCHCGAVRVTFRATRPVDELTLRRCDCSFCRRHNARTVADPGGEVLIRAKAGALRRYRFGLRVTDMLLCAECGVYIAAQILHEGRPLVTLNANVLEMRDTLDPVPPLVSYAGETAGQRLARRLAHWTLARLDVVGA